MEYVKPIIDRAHVTVKLTVMESDPKVVPNMNQNEAEVLKELGGDRQWIPYLLHLKKREDDHEL